MECVLQRKFCFGHEHLVCLLADSGDGSVNWGLIDGISRYQISILMPPAYNGEPHVLGHAGGVGTIIYALCGGMWKGLQCAWVKF